MAPNVSTGRIQRQRTTPTMALRSRSPEVATAHMHEEVKSNVSFPALEEEILEWWKQAGVQRKALTHREGAPEFVFYEGPPYANAPPGVHNVLPRVIKDVYTRFQSMLGNFVPRKAGWDCHGLPAEVEVEKKLGFEHKREIVDYGIEKFNNLCRTAVSEY